MPPPRQHGPPALDQINKDTTWDELLALWFAADEDGGIYCVSCGGYIKDGWQADHYDDVHGFKGF